MEIQTPVTSPRRRPDFLTVLCILTFIGSGFGLLNAFTNYINADVLTEFAHEAIDKSREKVSEDLSGGEKRLAEKIISGASSMLDPKKLKQNYLLTFIGNLFTLFGAILMFRMRKTGFWLYVAGTVALVAAPVIIFGPANLLGLGISFTLGLVGILFIVLYSLNLKHLNQ